MAGMRAFLLLSAGLSLLSLSACRYNFAPLIPAQTQVQLPVRLVQATLKREGDMLRLSAKLDGRFQPDYLRAYWFDGSRELGQDSVYLDAGQQEANFTLEAARPGAYRAVLAFGGTVLRQVELTEVQP